MKPTLYYYEHCPYCVRVLAMLGLAEIAAKYVVLLNDDEETPTAMIGKKMVPILQTSPETYLAESLDIVDYLSQHANFSLLQCADWETEANDLIAANRQAIYALTMPRWVKAPLKEFASQSAIDYFVKKKTITIGDFDMALANTSQWVVELTQGLQTAKALFAKLANTPNSRAAIILFSGLYGIRYVEEMTWPTEAKRFMQIMSTATGLAVQNLNH